MPLHSKILILSLHILSRQSSKGGTTGEVYDLYCDVAKKFGLEPLTQRRSAT